VYGLDRGHYLMIGGEEHILGHLDPIFETLASEVEPAARIPDTSEQFAFRIFSAIRFEIGGHMEKPSS
jgi:6-phosphogluconate dehydrogenase (decarboxylating)